MTSLAVTQSDRIPRMADRGRTSSVLAGAASLVFHGLVLALVLADILFPRPLPDIRIDEPIPVEIVEEPRGSARDLAGANLPLVRVQPADPAAPQQPAAAGEPARPLGGGPLASVLPTPGGLTAARSSDPAVATPIAPPAAPLPNAPPERALASLPLGALDFPRLPSPAPEELAPAPDQGAFISGAGDVAATQLPISGAPAPDLPNTPPPPAAQSTAFAALQISPAASEAGRLGPALAEAQQSLPARGRADPAHPSEVPAIAALAPLPSAPSARRSEEVAAVAPSVAVALPAVRSRPAAEASPSEAPAEAQLQPFDLSERVRGAFRPPECSRVSLHVDALAGTVSVSGHARTEADRSSLVRQLENLPDVRAVDASGLGILGDPFCGVLALLDRPELQRSSEQRFELASLASAQLPSLHRLQGGRALSLAVGAPDFDSYVYVDYFSTDGTVVHLLPMTASDNFVRAQEGFRLGPSGRGRRVTASEPYGLDLVVVLAVSEPLFDGPRPPQENAKAYLALLNGRLDGIARRGGARAEYAYYLVATEPPGP